MNKILEELLNKPMKHISDVRECFDNCTCEEDVETVIDMIPHMFGTFDAEYNNEEGTFRITNSYEDSNLGYQVETVDYDFQEADSDA